MLRFFRQIRQRLLIDSKISKYLLYAIGEILLVVIGILIALQVDNWNEQRQERDRLNNYLFELKNSLKKDIIDLRGLENVNLFRFRSLYYLTENMSEIKSKEGGRAKTGSKSIKFQIHDKEFYENINSDSISNPTLILALLSLHIDDDPDNDSSEIIQRAFDYLHFQPLMRTNSEAYEELKNTGYFSMIQDTSLRSEINRYYTSSEWYFNDLRQSIALKEIEKWRYYLIEHHGILTDELDASLDQFKILNDPLTLLYIKELSYTAEHRSVQARLMKEEAWKLIRLINNRLGI
ncbi:DUF6090 family protein [Robiginitalea sp. IMCC43444]|uniref:DUF6090 family protein n=1 Tax=Robiginitalea sp. IMCC43444 TaxID=3459121 RepID=UPI0040437CEB